MNDTRTRALLFRVTAGAFPLGAKSRPVMVIWLVYVSMIALSIIGSAPNIGSARTVKAAVVASLMISAIVFSFLLD